MGRRRVLKLVHFSSTAWFMLSVGYILVFALWQAGKSWWFIVSLSGYSALIIFLLISFYLFAVFRGVARSQKTVIEHPLTSSIYYSVFYDTSPFLGALAGVIGAIGVTRVTDYLAVITIGSFGTTFLIWIIIDPIAGIIEMMLPASRVHRRQRLEEARIKRQEENLANQRILDEIQSQTEQEKIGWDKALQPYAQRLAILVSDSELPDKNKEYEVVDIGVYAWRMGGIECMRRLHTMVKERYKQKIEGSLIIDYISIWWDGIGSWRNSWLEGELV